MKKKCQLGYNKVGKLLGNAHESADDVKEIEDLKQLTVEVRSEVSKHANGPHLAYKSPIKSLISALDKKSSGSTFAPYEVELIKILMEVLKDGTKVEKKILETASVYSQNGLALSIIDQADSGEYSNAAGTYSSLGQTITLHKEHLTKNHVVHEYLHAVLDGVFQCQTLPYNDENERALYKTALAKTFNNMNQFLKVINANFNSCLKTKDIQIKPNYSSNIDDDKELSSLLNSYATFINKVSTANGIIKCEYSDVLNGVYHCMQAFIQDPAIEAEAITHLFSDLGSQDPLATKLLEPLYSYYNEVVEPAFDAYIEQHKPAEHDEF